MWTQPTIHTAERCDIAAKRADNSNIAALGGWNST
jgi:hypothetical protein